jgi:hypothetical protein
LRNGIVQFTNGQPLQNYWNSITNSAGATVGTTTVQTPYLSPPVNSTYNLYIPNNLYVGGTIYGTVVAPSDERLKTNIVNALSGNIDDIKVRSFDWIADGSHQEYGMVAQELLEVAPYAVHQPTNPDEMMGVDYSKLVPMMIKEIQDLKQRIATLENK